MRIIAQNLQPSALEHLGLVASIQDLVAANRPPNGIPAVSFQHYNFPGNLAPATALQLYRIIQEALHNALKHAEASEILIQLNGEKDGYSILVEDDGKGFDTTKVTDGNGLENMQKRAEFLGTELTIDSGGRGTTVFLNGVV